MRRMPDTRNRLRRTPESIAAELDATERIVLFCIGSHTNLAKAVGSTSSMLSRLIVKGLIERDASWFVITRVGREVLMALVAGE